MASLPQLIADPVNFRGIFWLPGPPPSDFLPGKSSAAFDESTGDLYTLNASNAWVQLGAAGSTAWSAITGTPTTIGGYGITDAYTKAAADARYAAIATTLAGYGITDAYTKTASDARYQAAGSYQTPQTTLGGYGITDAYTKSAADARYLQSVSFAGLTSHPTTISGYGITDAYTASASDARYLQLSGGTLTGGLSGTTATFSSTLHAGGAVTFGSTLDVTGEISAPSASIGGYPAALVRSGAYTSVPTDLVAGQIFFGY